MCLPYTNSAHELAFFGVKVKILFKNSFPYLRNFPLRAEGRKCLCDKYEQLFHIKTVTVAHAHASSIHIMCLLVYFLLQNKLFFKKCFVLDCCPTI